MKIRRRKTSNEDQKFNGYRRWSWTRDRADGHEKREAHKISEELIHHNFAAAHKELQKEATHPHEFKKIVELLKHDLKSLQNELTVHHDKHGNVTHIDFDKHDIFDKAKAHEKEKHRNGGEHEHEAHHGHHSHSAPKPDEPARELPKKTAPLPPVGAVPLEVPAMSSPPSVSPSLASLDGNKFLDPQQKTQIRLQAQS